MPRQTRESDAAPHAIIVMGVSGSGKSTLAALLAARLGCRFIEGDSFHSAANVAKMHAGKPLTDADRWPWLDTLGAEINRAMLSNGLAVTACSALKRSYRDRLRAAITAPAAFVLLEADQGELMRRLRNRPGHFMPASLLESQLATLEPPTDDERALMLDTRVPVNRLADDVLSWLALPRASILPEAI